MKVMKSTKLKIFGIAAVALLFAGCNSPRQCIKRGYDGAVMRKTSAAPDIHCSNGNSTPNGRAWITSDGDILKSGSVYAEFLKEPTKTKEW